HMRMLPYAELPELWQKLSAREGTPALALRYLILCAARAGEVVNMRWSEVDLAAQLWTIPAERAKTGAQHRVPLAQPATELLRSLPRGKNSDHVFIGRQGHIAGNSLLALVKDRATIHGFRSTFSTWAHETTTINHEVIEGCLAHKIGNKVSQAYN